MTDHEKHIKVHMEAYAKYMNSYAKKMIDLIKIYYGEHYIDERNPFSTPSELE